MKILLLLILISFGFVTQINAQKSNFVKTSELEIHYLEYGKGVETIVLIHGLSDTAEIWKKFAPLLAQKYRVIAVDRRGVGKTQKTKSGYELKTFAKDIRQLLNKLKLNKVHLVGHSFGGNIAMKFAAEFPEKLNSLTLIEGGFWDKKENIPEIPDCPKPIDVDCLIGNQILAESYAYDPKILFPKVEVPVLLVMGVPDFSKLPVSDAERNNLKTEFQIISDKIKEKADLHLKNGKFFSVTNADHWVFNDQPEILAKKLLEFYKTKISHKS